MKTLSAQRQVNPAYVSTRGVKHMGVTDTVRSIASQKNVVAVVPQMKVVSITPKMTEAQRTSAQKRIGNDLFEVFIRIQEHLKSDNEL